MITSYFTYTSFSDEFTDYIPRVFGEVNEDLKLEIFEHKICCVTANSQEEIEEFILSQEEGLNITEISEIEFKSLYRTTNQAKTQKMIVRNHIRDIKDVEDDLSDQKLVIQSIQVFLSELYFKILTTEQKESINEKINFEKILLNYNPSENILRSVTEQDKLLKIIADEQEFSEIAKKEYLSKVR